MRTVAPSDPCRLNRNPDHVKLAKNGGRPVVVITDTKEDDCCPYIGWHRFSGELLGWHRGQCGAFSRTLEQCVADMAEELGETVESLKAKCRFSFVDCDPLPGCELAVW